jgi:hypothetical protein
MATIPPLASAFGPTNFTAADLDPNTMDTETMTLLVMSRRAAISQDYLNVIFTQTQGGNDQIKEMNAHISGLLTEKTSPSKNTAGTYFNALYDHFPANAGNPGYEARQVGYHFSELQGISNGTSTRPDYNGNQKAAAQWFINNKPVWDRADDAFWHDGHKDGYVSLNDKNAFMNTAAASAPISLSAEEKAAIDNRVRDTQANIESLNNLQQIMMIKLQKAGATVNESYDMMSACLKKIDDSRSSIIQKM